MLIGTTQGMAAAGQRCGDGGKAAGVTPQEDAQHVSPAQHAQPVQGKPELLPRSDVLEATPPVIWGCSLVEKRLAEVTHRHLDLQSNVEQLPNIVYRWRRRATSRPTTCR